MQCDDVEIQLPRPCLSEIDSALNELGMLATRTNSREEYLSETRDKKYLKMLTINTRYVSNVSIGFRVRPMASHVRYKPYNKAPKERHRTRSENNDNDSMGVLNTIVDECVENPQDDLNQLKKAKSLESIIAENNQNIDFASINVENCKEVEVVSNCIQNLRVDE